jgi:hypothetical protein
MPKLGKGGKSQFVQLHTAFKDDSFLLARKIEQRRTSRNQ